MRILLYGFGPYKRFRDNITTKIVKSIPPRRGLTKLIFPVRFHRRQFVESIKKHRPDVVVGIGQSSRPRIEVEARAKNRRRVSKHDSAKPIRRRGPRWLATTLALKLGRQARASTNAGDYVCNYSLYVALDHINRNKLRTAVGFLHIPYDYDARKAGKLIRAVLRKLKSAAT